MPSRLIIRSIALAIATAGIGVLADDAHAGIIVTVGRPCPEMNQQKPRPAQNPNDGQRPEMYPEGADGTRCVQLPDGSTRCGKSIRVESVNVLPADWRCIPVAKSVLYCETPMFGASPGASGEGDFDPDEYIEDIGAPDEEVQALGCQGGDLGAGALLGLGGLGLLMLRRRVRPIG